MKKILGLDLGTNSIGWALIEQDFNKKEGEIKGLGSRIIPMSQDILGKFDSGVTISQTAERTKYRSVRRLIQRNTLRRERLHRVLHILNFLPKHYAHAIDFEKHVGQFKKDTEVKLNYRKNEQNKYEFIFKDSFNEMIQEFKENRQSIKIPYDWTLYYLRKKALTKKISKEELAWILLNFNQKRGYYQLRGEEEDTDEFKNKEFVVLTVKEIIDSQEKVKGNILYDVFFENGWKYDKQIVKTEDWIGKTKEFIITTSTNKDGTIKRSFKKVDSEKDWIAIKKKTEQDINKSKKHIGVYIYDSLLENPTQKIRGKLIKTIERHFYKKELEAILKEQTQHHPELQNKTLYQDCIHELYPRNEAHQNNIKDKLFNYLFIEDIIFYQRPLKSKKSTISNCPYENRVFIKDSEKQIVPLKCISKSNPLFQEFRLWQFLKNLNLYQKERIVNSKTEIDVDVTSLFLQTEDDWVNIFDFLNTRKEIDQKAFVNYFIGLKLIPKSDKDKYRWNYVKDRKYPCNETKSSFLSRLKKVKGLTNPLKFLNKITHTNERSKSPQLSVEAQLWHVIYSVKDIKEFEKALERFALKHELDVDSFVENFKKHPPFDNSYGAYSEKAIKKLLPLMRRGIYWNKEDILIEAKERIADIVERLESIDYNKEIFKDSKKLKQVIDDAIPQQLLKSFIDFKDQNPLTGLNTYQACYAVYERHSEASDVQQWNSPKDINLFLENFKQHSLRNPTVEQVITETLRVVRDIWITHGNSQKDFFNEIHVELGREMKNDKKTRERLSKQNTVNENTNQRIRTLLQELKDEGIHEIKPYSPSQQEILKIYEEGVFQNPNTKFDKVNEDEILKIRKNTSPTKSEINRYKLWLEQGYISPYTGDVIPLSKLFTTAYQIEHIIPQSRYFDDSMSNKIICESDVNQLKGNQTAYEFIKKHGTEKVGSCPPILKLEDYEAHCNKYFKNNNSKLKKLLSEDIPEGFINRQLNDSRYISKIIKGLLSNIVREEGEREATSKNLIPVTGSITSKMKRDWGLNDQWNALITPRFKRLNEMTNSQDFGYIDQQLINGKPSGNTFFRIQVPEELSKGFSKKRIDHRHHALDALVIACITPDHTNYITSLNTERYNSKLISKLRVTEEKQITDKKTGALKTINIATHYHKPWETFTTDVKHQLDKTIISFKQNTRIINKTNNKTWQWIEKDGQLKKELTKQTQGNNWAIRKPMHKETVSGKILIKQKKKGLSSLINYIENWELIADKTIRHKVKNLFVLFNKDLKSIKTHLKKHPILINNKEVTKIKVYEKVTAMATRISITEKFTRKQLESVTDSGIQQILENHIKNYIDNKGKEQFDLAFNASGLEELNKNIVELNNGKKHHPIYKVRLYEIGSKFNIGESGNKKTKFVEAAKGTNLFFAIYWNKDKQQRVYETIPLNEVIEHQKWHATLSKEERKETSLVPIKESKGQFLFSLSPNDLVFIPNDDEINNPNLVDFENLNNKQINRIYKMVSCTGNECHFIKNDVASLIKKYDSKTKIGEFGSLNKSESDLYGNKIKNICWKLKIDRLGNIIKVIK